MRARVRRSTSRTRSTTRRHCPFAFLSAAGLALFVVAVAVGIWSTGGAGDATAGVGTLNAPTNVAGNPSSSTVAVSWTASVPAFGLTPQGYYVTRVSNADSSISPACSSDATHLISGTSCSDTGVATGSYQYVVTAVYATWTAASLASANVVVVDVPPPYVVSLSLADPSPTKTLSALHWTVTFSSSVTGVNSSDFTVASTGLGGTPAITGVTGANTTYTVTASSGTGTGTLGVNLVDNGSIIDVYNQPLADSSGGPNGNFTGDAYTVDRTGPTNSLSLVAQSGGGSYLTGTTVFYEGTGSGAGGSFAIRNTVPDVGGAGGASSTTTTLGGTSTGWTHTPGTDSTPPGGPFDSNAFTWTEGTTSAPTEAITSADAAGNNSAATTLTFKNDVTAPTSGALKVNNVSASLTGTTSFNGTGGFTIGTRTNYAETASSTASGLASSVLPVQSATVTNNTCGGYGAPTTVTGNPTQAGLTTGCYLFTLTGTDNVGNYASVSTTVIVDTTPPAAPTLAFSNLNNASYNSSLGTLFFRKAAGGTYIVTASSSDPDTALAAGNAGYTFTPVTGNNFTGVQTGGQVSYTFTTTATQPAAARTVTATNIAGGISAAASYTAILDSTAPTGGALTVNGVAAATAATASISGTGVFSVDARTDWVEAPSAAAAGLATSTLVRDQTTLNNGTCGTTYTSAVTLTGTPDQSLATGNCYRFTLTGTDLVGNAASVSTIVKVDLTPPVTTDNTAVLGNGWFKTVTVTLTATDPGGAGVAATYYTTDGSTPTTSSTRGTSISFAATGQYTIQYFSVDLAGNVEQVETASTVIRVDKTPPTSSFSLASGSGAFWSGSRLFYKSNAAGSFTLTNTVSDAESGPASATFPAIATTGWTHNAETVNTPAGGPFTSSLYSWTASPSAPGTAGRTMTSSDVVGNVGSTALTFTVDNTAPTGGVLNVNGVAASAVGTTSSTLATTVPIATRTDYIEAPSTSASGRRVLGAHRSVRDAGERRLRRPRLGRAVRDGRGHHRHHEPGPDAGLLLRLHAHRHRPGRQRREHQHHRRRPRSRRHQHHEHERRPDGGQARGRRHDQRHLQHPARPEHRPRDGVDHALQQPLRLLGVDAHADHDQRPQLGRRLRHREQLRDERVQPDRRGHVHPERRSPDRHVHDHRHARCEREEGGDNRQGHLRPEPGAGRPRRRCRSRQLHDAGRDHLVLDEDVRDRDAKALLRLFARALLQPAGLLIRARHHQDLVGREGAKRVLDRLHRVGVADARLDIVGGRSLGGLLGDVGCLRASIVLRVGQPVEPRDVRRGRNHEHLGVVARAAAHEVAQHVVCDRTGDHDEQTTRHQLLLRPTGWLPGHRRLLPGCSLRKRGARRARWRLRAQPQRRSRPRWSAERPASCR